MKDCVDWRIEDFGSLEDSFGDGLYARRWHTDWLAWETHNRGFRFLGVARYPLGVSSRLLRYTTPDYGRSARDSRLACCLCAFEYTCGSRAPDVQRTLMLRSARTRQTVVACIVTYMLVCVKVETFAPYTCVFLHTESGSMIRKQKSSAILGNFRTLPPSFGTLGSMFLTSVRTIHERILYVLQRINVCCIRRGSVTTWIQTCVGLCIYVTLCVRMVVGNLKTRALLEFWRYSRTWSSGAVSVPPSRFARDRGHTEPLSLPQRRSGDIRVPRIYNSSLRLRHFFLASYCQLRSFFVSCVLFHLLTLHRWLFSFFRSEWKRLIRFTNVGIGRGVPLSLSLFLCGDRSYAIYTLICDRVAKW